MGYRYCLFLEAVGFAHAAFEQVAVYGAFEVSFGNGDQDLMVGEGLIGVGHEEDLVGEQIKRGALVEELLDIFFFLESFFPGEREFPHRDQIKSISSRETVPERIICALRSFRQKR